MAGHPCAPSDSGLIGALDGHWHVWHVVWRTESRAALRDCPYFVLAVWGKLECFSGALRARYAFPAYAPPGAAARVDDADRHGEWCPPGRPAAPLAAACAPGERTRRVPPAGARQHPAVDDGRPSDWRRSRFRPG